MSPKRALRVALVGRPNTGKSSLFNRLTGLNQKVGNYPGVTMEKHLGLAKIGSNTLAEVIDLPGVYSLHPSSDDERVVLDALTTASEAERSDVVVGLADGTNLKTCLFVFTQVLDLGFPAVNREPITISAPLSEPIFAKADTCDPSNCPSPSIVTIKSH